MKRWTILGAIIVGVALSGSLIWSLDRQATLSERLDAMAIELTKADSIAQEAKLARYSAEHSQMEKENAINGLRKAFPELDQRLRAYERERDEAVRQEQAKDIALKGQQSALDQEAAQKRIAEARSDSLANEKRKTDNLNLQQNSSLHAQNSLAVKGRPAYRGLMAVHALRSMEKAGGDVNKDELVQALRSALEELERPAPVRVSGFKRPPHHLVNDKGRRLFLALGNDAVLHRVDMDSRTVSVVVDHSRSLEPGTGSSFLSTDHSAMILTDRKGNIAAHPLTDGPVIAKSTAGSASRRVRAVASWPGLAMVVTGDASGNVQLWRKEGGSFRSLENWKMGAAIKGMAYDVTTHQVVVIAATGAALVLAQDATSNELSFPTGQIARCIASAGNGILLIGTEKGAVLWMDLQKKRVTVLREGGGQRIESITCSPGTDRIAYVNAVKELIVLNGTSQGPPVRIVLDAIPGALVLGVENEVYLAFSDRVERLLSSSRSMAARICELIGRTWTATEWNEIGETGTPEPTCVGF